MKRLLIAPLLLMLTSCGYGSKYEAKRACEDWVKNGGTYSRNYTKINGLGEDVKKTKKADRRWCRKDATNKFLGIEIILQTSLDEKLITLHNETDHLYLGNGSSNLS